MIRAVREFFSLNGRCREVTLEDGPHHPVLLSIEQLPGATGTPGGGRGSRASGLRVTYRGQKEDLLALGCISGGMLAGATLGRYYEDPLGALFCVEASSSAGRRKEIEVSYLTQSRPFANSLPGVQTYCADWLAAVTGRPRLRVVVDNTRRLSASRAQPAARGMRRASRD